MKISVREVTIIVEKEDAMGPNMPVFVLQMGKYNVDALSIIAQDWSTHVSAIRAPRSLLSTVLYIRVFIF